MELGKPTFVPVQDREMGFEKIVKIAHSRGGKILSSEPHFNHSVQMIREYPVNCSMQAPRCRIKIEG